MENKIISSLIFDGNAELAIAYYTSLFEDLEVKNIARYKYGEAGREDSLKHAVLVVKGQEFLCIDRSAKRDHSITPAASLYINCDSKHEIKMLFNELSRNGKVFIDLTSYGFSDLYGWVEDKFGVSWQLNLD